MTKEVVLIPSEHLIKDATKIEDGSLMLTCKYCGGKFAVPPEKANTPGLAEATCCDDPRCVEKMNAELAAQATADLKAAANKTAADTVATALGK